MTVTVTTMHNFDYIDCVDDCVTDKKNSYFFVQIKLNLVKHLIIKISEKSFTQRCDASMASFSSDRLLIRKTDITPRYNATDFDNLSGSHLQSQSNIASSVDGIYVSGYSLDWSIKLSCYWL